MEPGGAAHRAAAPAQFAGRTNWLLPLAVSLGSALIAFGVYVRTLAPSVPTGDSGELTAAAWLLGVAHPPGYPLFTMLGHLFTLLPFGSPAFRVNLMSAVFHAATVGVTSLSIYRLVALGPDESRRGITPRDALAGAAVGGLTLAFSNPFWTYAVVAEVFALNSFLAALIFSILLEWERRPQRLRLLWAFGLTSGLAAANHHTIVFTAPACLVLLVSGTRTLLGGSAAVATKPFALARHGAIAAALLVAGLLPYVYLPLAAATDPALNWGDPRTSQALFRHVTRADYGTFRLTVTDQPVSGSRIEHVEILLRSLYDGFTLPGSLLAIAGLWWLCRRRPAAGLAVAVAFLGTGPGFVAFANPRIQSPLLYGVLERFYILPAVFAAVAIGAGACQVVSWALRFAPIREPSRLAPLVGTALLAIPIGAAVTHFARADHSDNLLARRFGEDLLAPIEPGALFITQGDVVTIVVDYVQLVEGVRRDITTLNIEKLKLPTYVHQMRRQHPGVVIPFESYTAGGDMLARLVEANVGSRPVYLFATPKDPGFLDRFDVQRAGFALRLLPKGSGTDPFGIVRAKLDLFRHMHYPAKRFPDTTFESLIVSLYGRLAFSVAYVLDDGVRNGEAAEFYRLSLTLEPKNPPAYKNLGLVLLNSGAPRADVAALWEEYLRQDPHGEQAPAIRERLRLMGRLP